jgi:hypothetical protein
MSLPTATFINLNTPLYSSSGGGTQQVISTFQDAYIGDLTASTIKGVSTLFTNKIDAVALTNVSSINGQGINSYIGEAQDWSLYPAKALVDISGNDISGANVIRGNDLYVSTIQNVDSITGNLLASQPMTITAGDGSIMTLGGNTLEVSSIKGNSISTSQIIGANVYNSKADIEFYSNNISSLIVSDAGIKPSQIIDVSGVTGSVNQVLIRAADGVKWESPDATSYLPLAGGTMSGAINMNGNNLSNVGDLTAGGIAKNVAFGTNVAPMANITTFSRITILSNSRL